MSDSLNDFKRGLDDFLVRHNRIGCLVCKLPQKIFSLPLD